MSATTLFMLGIGAVILFGMGIIVGIVLGYDAGKAHRDPDDMKLETMSATEEEIERAINEDILRETKEQ